MLTDTRPGIVTLVTDAVSRSADLLQTEFRLARAELKEKFDVFKTGLIMILVGCVFLIAALILILQALIAALIESGLAPHWAILIVAGGSAVGGLVVLLAGQKHLSDIDPTPTRTVDSLSRDAEMAKEKLK
jgi:hypothetical protein